jgi:pilus assembly protein CpaB
MQRFRPFIVLGAGGLMALVTSIMVFSWLSNLEKPDKPNKIELQTSMVAVVSKPKPWGTTLSADMIKMVPYPKESLPTGHFASVDRLKGRVLLANLIANEPILESKLAPVDITTGGVAAVTDPSKRAMAIKVDEVVGVAGFVNPGNRVDVLVSLRTDPPTTKIVVQNVLVLATGTEIERRGKEQEPLPVKVITLVVTPEEAEKLALAASQGKVTMALRNQLNAEPILTKGETLKSLLESYSLKGQKNKQAKQTRVEVIKGDQVKTLTFAGSYRSNTRVIQPSSKPEADDSQAVKAELKKTNATKSGETL